MRLRPPLVATATSLLVAACGGSSHGSSATATAAPAASSQTTTTTSAIGAVTGTDSVNGDTAVTSTTVVPPEVPKAKKRKHRGSTHAASQGAHVETHMTVSAAGDVSPPVVSVPSGVGVEIHVTNHGSAADTVTLSVPTHPSVKVPPGASGTLQTAGLKDGTYRILVNGTPRGQLMIGAQGGP